MDSERITLNFILSPTNISGLLTSKVETKGLDPVPILLYAFLNSVIMSVFIYLLINQFYDRKLALLCVGVYLIVTFLLGVIFGIVDQFI